MKNFRLITIIILAFATITLMGCMKSNDPAVGGACGTVVDSNGNALSGVTIMAGGSSAVSDYYGNWSFSSLKPQVLDFVASKENYQTQSKTYEVLSGIILENIHFVMPAAGEIYDIVISSVSSTKASISFQTKYEADTSIVYGCNALMDKTINSSSAHKYTHTFEITGLTPATTYTFQCKGVDKYKRTITSPIMKFTTTASARGEVPTGLKITKVTGNSAFNLTWNSDSTADFAGFNVYRANTETGVFTKINVGAVMQSAYQDMGVHVGEKYVYRVTRLSGSGDETSPSATVSMVMPGIINDNVVWNAQNSPYELSGDLTIAKSGSLIIAKNTTIRVARGEKWDVDSSVDKDLVAINVYGTLMIEGNETEPVSITSAENFPTNGDWDGIIFKDSADLSASSIKGLNVQFAKNGIRGEGGLPSITDSTFKNCSECGISCASATADVLVENVSIVSCKTGASINDSLETVNISNSRFSGCSYAIKAINNNFNHICENKIMANSITAIEVAGINPSSAVSRNTIGWCSGGTGIVCRGSDEIRRNTVQANICIEIKEEVESAFIRSNLLLADNSRNGIGVLYNGSETSSTKVSIQNNGVWNQTNATNKYGNTAGFTFSATGDLAFSSTSGPALQGGDPFTTGLTDSSFSYVPSAGSPLKGAGYDSYEDVGAENVPN